MITSPEPGWTLRDWRAAYAQGRLTPDTLIGWVGSLDVSDPAWIHVATASDIDAQLQALKVRLDRAQGDLTRLPLYGVPFAAKDNIDAKGWATTAACPAFARVATEDATVVALLREAGAILVGKTNMDQFATGLVGTRSPYGAVPSSFNPAFIGGGSSSGSAAVVARGWVPFALGTDTAGSGRVPAAFQNIVGWKPTRGRFSTRGIVPACKTLDCASVFGLCVDDVATVAALLDQFDAGDPYSRRRPFAPVPSLSTTPKLAVPQAPEFFGDDYAKEAFELTLNELSALGVSLVPVDFTPFQELARLLYTSPWVVERYLTARLLLNTAPDVMDPVVREIIGAARGFTAQEAFSAEYQRAELARQIETTLSTVDALVVPTTPTTYRLAEVAEDPFGTNSRLGTYTNFTNLADLSGLALPGVFRRDGLPAGVTLLGLAHREPVLAELARQLETRLDLPLGATRRPRSAAPLSAPVVALGHVPVAVVGAHLRGMALNRQLTSRGAVFLEETSTSPHYKLFLLPRTVPKKPGLLRTTSGAKIAVEVWSVPLETFGAFVAEVPAPLGIGQLELADGRWVSGFICEPWALEGAEEITQYGGFRAYLKSLT